MVDGVKDRIEGFLVIIRFSGSTVQRFTVQRFTVQRFSGSRFNGSAVQRFNSC
jgi:hypothetical protein